MKTVWILDDDDGILEATTIVLEEAGYSVLGFNTADELRKSLKDRKPNLLLLDVLLSGDDGCDITQKLKEEKATKEIPVLLMSANNNIENRCIESGASSFIRKPFDIFELESAVKEYIA